MVLTQGYQVFLCNTVTGKINAFIPPSKQAVGERLNAAGPLTHSLQVDAAELVNLNVRNATTLLRQSIGVAYNGTILECGPLIGRHYDPSTEELQLTGTGLWWLLDHRKTLPGSALAGATATSPGAGKPTYAGITLTGLSLGSIARELVRISIQDNPWIRSDGSNGGALNIVLPPVVTGTNQRTYNGYDMGWMGDRLRELTAVEGGPDIRFRPRFNGADPTFVEWVMETGSPTQPLLQQTGTDWVWDGTVPDSALVSVAVTEDASTVGTRAWVPGNGQAQAMLMAWSTDTTLLNAGYPWIEVDTASKQVSDPAILQTASDRLLADSAAPWDQWTLTVRANQAPLLGSYQPGDWAQVIIPPGHPMLDPGPRRVRIMALDGDGTETVKITVAPMQGSFDTGGYATSTTLTITPVAPAQYPGTSVYPSTTLYPQGL